MRKQESGLPPQFWARRPLIGMVHLPALPGSPLATERSVESMVAQSLHDANALAAGGATAIMVENFFDVPFSRDQAPPHTVAAMTLCVHAVRQATGLPVGVNVLRNDARSAIAIAHVTGARFVRINVYVGAAVTDQGLIQGAAREAQLYRRELGADVEIWADVFVKHAAQLGTGSLEDAARDAVHRGLADALIVSGDGTGRPTDPDTARRVREAVPGTHLLVGSGFSVESADALLEWADGAIVGTSLKRNGDAAQSVEIDRVRRLRKVMDEFVIAQQ